MDTDTETIHTIKRMHLPENSGDHYGSKGQKPELALLELQEDANICTPDETKNDRCWKVTPVRLPDPSIIINDLEKVRTLGNQQHFHAVFY